MAEAVKAAVKKDEAVEADKVLLLSVYPSYALVLQEEKYEMRELAGGKMVRVPIQEGKTLNFHKGRAFISEELLAVIKKTKAWYGSDFISAQDLAAIYKTQQNHFSQIAKQMYERQVIGRVIKDDSHVAFHQTLMKDLMAHGGLKME